MDIPDDLRYDAERAESIMREGEHDKYDDAIVYLCLHPEDIIEAYRFSGEHVAGCLFMNAGHHPHLFVKLDVDNGGHWLRDPITIKGDTRYLAETVVVTEAIRSDELLPSSIEECGLQHLPRVAWWQRKLDRLFNRRVEHVVAVDTRHNEEEEDIGEGDDDDMATVQPIIAGS